MLAANQIPAGDTNIIITYLGVDYIAYPCNPTAGATFQKNGIDVTSDITAIDTATFVSDCTVVIDPYFYIVDDNYNAYMKVLNYQSSSTTKPTRV